MTTLNHPEITAMQGIVDALDGLSAAQRGSVARKIRLTGDPEIAAMERVLAALKDVKGAPARTRVIDWAMDAYKAPTVARKPKAPKEKEPAKASPVSPVRTLGDLEQRAL